MPSGVYVPGGKAVYPSTVLMCAIPAKVAGVQRIVMCTPPQKGGINPYLLVAADIAGVTEIYRVGGVQAIGALAFGTKTIARVDKIVGPGNVYVATAKRMLYGTVGIDMVAGPSELLVVADEGGEARTCGGGPTVRSRTRRRCAGLVWSRLPHRLPRRSSISLSVN